MPRTVAMILAGGEGKRLGPLTTKRAKPAVPFAARYRIIDFVLSNCVNSGIFTVGVLTQYRPRSLADHIRTGRPWDLDRSIEGGVALLQPYLGRRDSDWYAGTADAIQQNFDFLRRHEPENVLVLAGDHIYKLNYDIMVQFHREHQADVTVASIRVAPQEASRFGVIETDADYRVRGFEEKPAQPKSLLASMGVYVFRLEVLSAALRDDAAEKDSSHDFGRDVLPRLIRTHQVYAFPYGGYWVDVGTVQAYWEAHMDLLRDEPPLDLHDRSWVVYTRSEQRPPVDVRAGAAIKNCLIADGAVVAGECHDSIISPGVRIMAGAVVRESIVMNDAVIEAGAVVERAIIDKNVVIGANALVGSTESELGVPQLTIFGKNSRLPTGMRVGAGAMIGTDVGDADFPRKIVGKGKTVGLVTEGNG